MSDQTSEPVARPALAARYRATCARTERLCAPLEPDDYQLQSMPDCSPPSGTWRTPRGSSRRSSSPRTPGYRPYHPQFGYLFNSYYEAVGDRWPRPSRGLLSRPTIAEVYAYRRAIDEGMLALLESAPGRTIAELVPVIELGLNHEEQHQELLLTDLKHAFGLNPLRPQYVPPSEGPGADATPTEWEFALRRRAVGRPWGGRIRVR